MAGLETCAFQKAKLQNVLRTKGENFYCVANVITVYNCSIMAFIMTFKHYIYKYTPTYQPPPYSNPTHETKDQLRIA